jgi:ribosomal subunit interface protein
MQWQILFDHVSNDGDIQDKVEKKFSGLETYLGRFNNKVQTGFIRLMRGERWGYKVKVDLHLPGKEVVAEGKNETLLSAIDEAYGKAAQEIKKYLERVRDHRKRL